MALNNSEKEKKETSVFQLQLTQKTSQKTEPRQYSLKRDARKKNLEDYKQDSSLKWNFIFMTEVCTLNLKHFQSIKDTNFPLEKESQITHLCTKTGKSAKYCVLFFFIK